VTARDQKSSSQLDIAKKHIKVYNPESVGLMQWKEMQTKMRARLTELEAKAWPLTFHQSVPCHISY